MKRQTAIEYFHEKLGEEICKQNITENNSLKKEKVHDKAGRQSNKR